MTDKQSRHAVWLALSELFLDTTHSHEALQRIEDILRASPFDLATLDHIMRDEVFVVCGPNLFSIAGEWAGFDAAQVIAECTLASTRRPVFVGIRRYFRRRAIQNDMPDWQRIRDRLRESSRS